MLSTSTASLNQNKKRNEHEGEWLEGIKAYKGTMESAKQTLSFFDYIHFQRERKRGGERRTEEVECAQGNLLFFSMYKKKRYDCYTYSKRFF